MLEYLAENVLHACMIDLPWACYVLPGGGDDKGSPILGISCRKGMAALLTFPCL